MKDKELDNETYLSLDELKSSKNIADLLEESDLYDIGTQVVNGYEIDEVSRADWKDLIEKAMKIYDQSIEKKDSPWPNASNVKYPLIAEASITYAARTIPEIIQNDRLVKTMVIGNDPDGSQMLRGERVSKYLNYQLLYESPDWEEGLDQSLQMLPVLGTVFKKTYFSTTEDRVVSELCVPDKICVNYATKSLDSARRITHILTMYENDIIERQRSGLFCEDINIDYLRPTVISDDGKNNVDPTDSDYPIDLLEQHCWIDLDGDGYKEPYIVTAHRESKKILRIVNRFDEVELNDKDEVKRITAVHYFTDYHFIRSADGGFYSLGFGALLYPLNAAINTLINQLIDAGTLSNTQGGFLGRGLRIKNGEFQIKMGEWKVLDAASGTDISKNIVPIPVREPSDTLFKLLDLLMKVGQELSSTTDVLKGQQPAQNVAQGTISTLVDQGTKVFVAINKRFYRGLQKELRKVYKLNYKHLKNKHYREILQDPLADKKKDFELKTLDVYPVADPALSSDSQRFSRAAVLQQLQSVDKRAADYYMMKDVMHLEDTQIKQLQPPPKPQPPPPDQQKIMMEIKKMEAEMEQMHVVGAAKSAAMTLEAENTRASIANIQQQIKESNARIQESTARVTKMMQDSAHTGAKVQIAATKMTNQEGLKKADFDLKVEQAKATTMLNAQDLALDHQRVQIDAVKAGLDAAKLRLQAEDIKNDKSK
ncbi:hypothetical protein UFOVP1_62 [uncultured Caudovirales phage]|uniref:Uncharacterized protein n=1 Tax=uncultured Caudovirales phage TaxID=2100421 RepID=A0A6J5KHI1_9CAUD|nr:hypothetical protein UFOVP1_62 [uncultured Caudovirales phage]